MASAKKNREQEYYIKIHISSNKQVADRVVDKEERCSDLRTWLIPRIFQIDQIKFFD